MTKEKIYRFLHRAFWIIACTACLTVFLLNCLYLTEVSYNDEEIVSINHDFLRSAVLLVMIALLTAVIAGHGQKLEGINEQTLFWVLLGVYAVFAWKDAVI